MPVRVDIPIYLRVDPGALIERQDAVEDALAAAVGRALARSREAVLEPREGYGVRVHPPDFLWSGNAAGDIPASLRAEVEERIQATLANVIAASGILAGQEGEARETPPLSAPPEEALDPERFDPLLRLYAVPSYDQGGAPIAIPVDMPPAEPEPVPEMVLQARWRTIRSQDEFVEAVLQALFYRDREEPGTGYMGNIYKNDTGTAWITVRRYPEGEMLFDLPLGPLYSVEMRGTGRRARFVRVPVSLPPTPIYRIQWFASARTSDERLEALRRHHGPYLRQKLDESVGRLPAKIRAVDKAQAAEEGMEAILKEWVQDIPDEVTSFLLLNFDGQSYLLHAGMDVPTDLDAELLPLVTYQEGGRPYRPISRGRGGGGATGAAGGRGAGGTAARGGAGGAGGEGDGGDGAQRGGFVFTGAEAASAGGAFFPSGTGSSEAIVCEPFLGEPSVDELGSDGERMRGLIREIAYRLQIPECNFAGTFCLQAAQALGARASAVGQFGVSATQEGFTQPVAPGQGNMGLLNFTPIPSPALQLLRHLAAVTPLITELSRVIDDSYTRPEHRGKIRGMWGEKPVSWQLRFHIALSDGMKESVGTHFMMTCRILLMQLLRSSRASIDNRLARFDQYAPLFEQLMETQLADVAELITLRERLRIAPYVPTFEAAATPSPATWLIAAREVTAALSSPPSEPPRTHGPAGEIVQDGGVARIRDSQGRLWSMDQLEQAIVTRRGMAEEIDPLVKQMTEIPELMARFRTNRSAIRTELRRMLEEMQQNNQEMIGNVTDDAMYAFRASRIQETLRGITVPGTMFALQGIHLQAHEQIGEFFAGDPYYAAGLNYLFNVELGRKAIGAFFEFTGLTLLAIVCAPAAFLVGVAVSVYHYAEAKEKERLYGALIDPELVITRAEVEAELFAAKLGLALSFIPEAGTILRVGRYGVRAVTRAGVRGGARIMARYTVRRVTSHMAEQLRHGLVVAFAREVITNEVMDRVIGAIIEPVLAQVEREARITGPVGGTTGAEQTLRLLESEQQARRRQEGGGG